MNFDFIKGIENLQPLHELCTNAEILALDFPVQSVITCRKAMEFVVRLLYSASIDDEITGITVSKLLGDKRFISYMDDKSIMDAFHSIRVKGNVAAHHDSGIEVRDSVEILKTLHYIIGETSVHLELVDHYPEFDGSILVHTNAATANSIANKEEVLPDIKLVNTAISRLNGKRHFSEMTVKRGTIIKEYSNPVEMGRKKKTDKSYKGTDLATNSRIVFKEIGGWIEKWMGNSDLMADFRNQTVSFLFQGKETTFGIRSGACRLATVRLDGGWDYMPGMDYVIYCASVNPDKPIIEQFHVFTVEEFIRMWDETGFIRASVTHAQYNRVKGTSSKNGKVQSLENADALAVQTFKTAKKSRQDDLYDRINAQPLLTEFFG